MKNLFHSVDPLYISNLIFHNFLYRPYGVLIIPPQCLINALQKHNFSPSSNSFRSIPIPPPSMKLSLIIPVNKISFLNTFDIYCLNELLGNYHINTYLAQQSSMPLGGQTMFHVNSWENLRCRKRALNGLVYILSMGYSDNLSRYFYFLLSYSSKLYSDVNIYEILF